MSNMQILINNSKILYIFLDNAEEHEMHLT